MCTKLIYLVLIVLALSVTSGPLVAGVLYGNPPGGWRYIYTGDAAGGGGGGYTALDGSWSHDNGSDEWDGTAIGLGRPGGVSALGGYVRLQDCGDPRDHGMADPGSNRKIGLGHSVTADLGGTAAATILNAVTILFRARVATGAPLDAMYPDSAGDGENWAVVGGTPWPAGGNGYLGHDGGKGNFSVRQSGGDQVISFSLALSSETMKNRSYTFGGVGGQTGLVMNNLNTGTGFDTDPWEYDGTGETLNVLPLDVTAWHEYWITIAAGGSGTHLVKVYVDGSLVPTTFNVSAGNDNDFDVSYIGMDVGATGQMGAIDVDFFAYKPGLYVPGDENKAWQPIPGDEARTPPSGPSGTGYFMLLQFTPGDTATSHTAYFSSNFDNVNDRNPAFSLGSPPYPEVYPTGYYVGFDVPELPAFARVPLQRGTSYYWAVDESNGVETYPGDVWSFTIAAQQAWDPSPADGARYVDGDPTLTLSWKLGDVDVTSKDVSYDVYYGTVFADVNTSTTPNAHVAVTGTPPPPTASCVTGLLAADKDYYWRIDTLLTELGPPINITKTKGNVWHFETMPDMPITDPALIGWWTFDEGEGGTAFDWSGHENHGNIVGGAQRVPGQIDEAIELNGSSQNVAITGFDEIPGLPELTIAMWVKADDVTGEHYMWFTHETSDYGKVRCLVNGGNWIWRHGQGAAGNNPEVTSPATAGVWTHYAAVRIDNDQLYLYINGRLMAQTAFAAPGGAATNSWIGAQEGTGQYFDGLIDDVRVYNKALSRSDIQHIMDPSMAYNPSPTDGQTDVLLSSKLTWTPGLDESTGSPYTKHKVYFGTSFSAVDSATTPVATLTDVNTYSPALQYDTDYYWRIDGVNSGGGAYKGHVWTFKTIYNPALAWNPDPDDDATGAARNTVLSWTPGDYAPGANGHYVWFGADDPANMVRSGPQTPNNYTPSALDLDTTYYWAVDEVNTAAPGGVDAGRIWSFTTINNKVVDNFETYEDDPPPAQDVNWIYFVYTDGFGDLDCTAGTGNGSGAKIALQRPGQGGSSLAMTFQYDNDGMVKTPSACDPLETEVQRAYYSKAEAQVSSLPSGIGSDWTAGGAKALSLWFYGDPINSIEPIWVQLTDASNNKAKVFYGTYSDEDINDINEASWDGHEWLIDLEDFNVPPTRVNVKNVKSIAIGIGNETGPAGGSGTLYFDDIRLYTSRCVFTRRSADFAALDYAPEASAGDCVINARELEIMTRDWLLGDVVVTAAARPTPDPNLLAWWKFDDGSGTTAIDSSGKGLSLTLSDTTWEDGISGGAVHFHGVGQGQGGFGYSGNAITVCAWVRHDEFVSGQVERYVTIESEVAVIRKENDGRLHFYIKTGGSLRHLWVSGGPTIGQWHCVVGTWDGLTQRLYLDGVQRASQRPGGVLGTASGIRVSSSAEPFNGMLDDVRIYNYALTHGEVLSVAGVGTLYVPVPSPAELYEGEAEGSRVINFKDYALLTDRWLDEDFFP